MSSWYPYPWQYDLQQLPSDGRVWALWSEGSPEARRGLRRENLLASTVARYWGKGIIAWCLVSPAPIPPIPDPL